MASSSTNLLLLLLILSLSLLPFLSSARPCKTLFVSYSFSTFSSSDAVVSGDVGTAAAPVRFFSVYRVVSRPIRFFDPDPVPQGGPHSHHSLRLRREPQPHPQATAAETVKAAEEGWSSVMDSTRDILVVLAGLLFGVGCGAITAATMYLAWSLVANQHQICSADGEEEEGSDGDYGYEAADSPKTAGYVTMVQEPLLAASAAATKEGYEGK